MNIDQYFNINQKSILKLLNTEGGRFMLGVDERPIVKITPNSVHQLVGFEKDRVVLEAKMYTRDCFSSLILPLNKVDILDFEYKGKYDKEKAFLHYSNLQQGLFPQIFLTITNFDTIAVGDGRVLCYSGVWATARGGTGTLNANSVSGTAQITAELTDAYYIMRAFMPVNTSSLTASAVISAATFNHYITAETHAISYAICTVLGTQASYSTLVTSDFTQIGTTEGASRQNSPISLGALSIPLNATGLGWIQKTGITDFAFRTSNDLDNNPPAYNPSISELTFNTGDAVTNKPYLAVTYTLPSTQAGFLTNLI